MRKIKFRGQRIEDKKWIYGYYIIHKNKHLIIPENYDLFEENANIEYISPETVGQFTGLKDKNDKEIYEGDVIRAECRRFNGTEWVVHKKLYGKILFQISTFGIAHKKEKRDNLGEFIFYNFYEIWLENLEKVGNIYQNPELLK